MGRPIVDTRMFARLDRQFFTSRATVQQPQTAQDGYGAPILTWSTVARLQALPCYVAAGASTEVRGLEIVVTTDLRTVQLSAYYPEITTTMRVQVDGLPYDIAAVEHDSQLTSTRLRVRAIST